MEKFSSSIALVNLEKPILDPPLKWFFLLVWALKPPKFFSTRLCSSSSGREESLQLQSFAMSPQLKHLKISPRQPPASQAMTALLSLFLLYLFAMNSFNRICPVLFRQFSTVLWRERLLIGPLLSQVSIFLKIMSMLRHTLTLSSFGTGQWGRISCLPIANLLIKTTKNSDFGVREGMNILFILHLPWNLL